MHWKRDVFDERAELGLEVGGDTYLRVVGRPSSVLIRLFRPR
jgi:hypothetical protein